MTVDVPSHHQPGDTLNSVGVSDRAIRPFWMHQIVEYIIGITMISVAVQSPTPTVPAVLGVIILINPAFTRGPVGAFDVLDRRVHRWIDLVVIASVVVGAVQPIVSIDNGTRLLSLLLAVVLSFVWWHTDFASKTARQQRRTATAGSSGEEIGRVAGRAVTEGVRSVRRWKDNIFPDKT